MKVALIAFDFAEYTVALANALVARVDLALLLPEQELAPYSQRLHPSIDLVSFDKPRFRQVGRQLGMLGAVARQIDKINPTVVHLQQGHLWFNLSLPLLQRYPLVVTVHDPRHHVGDRASQKTPQRLLHFGFRRADELITHSEQLKQELVIGLQVPEARVQVIPHILIGDTSASQANAEDGLGVLFFGRIWEYKGLEYLIRAEPLITRRVPEAKIVIAGEGEDFERYRRMMVHPDRFVVHNRYISDEQRAALFASASVVVLPYIDASQSGVIPVAYAFGKPVVATTVGGLPEMVEEEQTGYLVPPRNEQALAEAVVRLLTDPEKRQAMGRNARRKAETELSPQAIARQTVAVYERALTLRREPARGQRQGVSEGLTHSARFPQSPSSGEAESGSRANRSSK